MVNREAGKKAERVTINLDEVIIRSDGSKVTMREFVKEMLFYNPEFRIESSKSGKVWYIKRTKEKD
ncbi:MAG: hypothetical protein QW390_02615 [Candidatus Bathyarchaeia archaeon]